MDEKSKDKSLRKKNSRHQKPITARQISAPIQVGPPRRPADGPRPQVDGGSRKLEVPRERPQQNARTADLVKRRYSTRFNQLPDDFNVGAPPIPALPSFPEQFNISRNVAEERRLGAADREGIKVDTKAVRDPNLQPDQYVASILADASEQEVEAYQRKLQSVKRQTTTDLQHNLFQNRTLFIKISKEAEKLKGEMQTLRKLMSELTTSIGQATAPTSSSVSNATPQQKRSNRSSIANLEALWTSHLQALWKRVEGSQKFLPAVPGRHIIYESGRWVELNAATWKAKRRIHMILLNDHLLVAAEKKRTEPSTQDPREARQNNAQGVGHFVAQRCWPLSDVQMLDLASRTATGGGSSRSGNTNASNAINVRVGIESFTYVTMGSEDDEKAILITTFRKAAEDMRQVQDAQAEAKERARDSLNYFALRDPAISEKHELVDGLAESADLSAASFTDSDGKERDLRWVEGQLDTLDIDIALQQCEQAVSVVENLRWLAKSVQSNSPVYNLVSAKIDARAEKLASIVVKQLLETHSQSGPTQENVGWLLKLGFEDRARIQYLTIRTVIFQKRLRQCVFDGDMCSYVYQISFICFTLIRNTTEVFQGCFPSALCSACVAWAKYRIGDFNAIILRQLDEYPEGDATRKECMQIVHGEAAVLKDVGLDLQDFIGRQDETDGSLPVKQASSGPQAEGLGLSHA